jgi:hypothetical protein
MNKNPSKILAALVVAFFCLSGCQSVGINNKRVAISDTTVYLAKQIDRAERLSWIDNATEDKLMDDLIEINQFLSGQIPLLDNPVCTDFTDDDCIDEILTQIEQVLIDAEVNHER